MHKRDTLEHLQSQLNVRASGTMRGLYVEYCAAKAAWEGFADVSSNWGANDIPDSGYCERYTEATNDLLLAPAETLGDLLLKFSIFDAEQIEDGWNRGREVVAQVASDARRFYRPEPA